MSDLFLQQKLRLMNQMLILTQSMDQLIKQEEFEKINDTLKQRERIMKQIDAIDIEMLPDSKQSPMATQINVVLRQIILLDQALKPKLETLKTESSKQLNKLKTAQTVTKGYNQTAQPDSFFFDKKK